MRRRGDRSAAGLEPDRRAGRGPRGGPGDDGFHDGNFAHTYGFVQRHHARARRRHRLRPGERGPLAPQANGRPDESAPRDHLLAHGFARRGHLPPDRAGCPLHHRGRRRHRGTALAAQYSLPFRGRGPLSRRQRLPHARDPHRRLDGHHGQP